mmetsp:Transcript_43745/g.140290  ORF Transcript_43745/g.140290 Transcript_43745/m.140290 type:complete len:81 (-) Transcript_43745:143-385(-)
MPKKPKRPHTAHFMFLGDEQKKLPAGLTGREAARQLAEAWIKLDVDEKKAWEERAAKAKEEYEKADEEYRNDPRIKQVVG